MKNVFPNLIAFVWIVYITGCQGNSKKEEQVSDPSKADTVISRTEQVNLPEPFATASATKYSRPVGWSAGKMPSAPAGFIVSKFADSLDNPRWIYVADNGDIFVAESNSPHSLEEKLTGKNNSADRITLFRDSNNDGVPDSRTIFLKDLNKPFGMLVIGNNFYVANTDELVKFPYNPSAMSILGKGQKIVELPGGPRHWTRNIITNAAKDKIYIAIGSGSNVAENGIDKEIRRACILEVNPDGTGEKLYAGGLRNPVGMAWAPGANTLWAAVNERDELGDDLVPDYLTGVKRDGFYGWPYSYYGRHEDPRMKEKQNPAMVAKAIVPDFSLGSHTASLGLAFYQGKMFPEKYQSGAFVSQHGSWNRSSFTGYKVVFVPFKNGMPSGKAEDFLTGFIANESNNEVYGRPAGIAVLKDGSLLIADDAGKTLWRVSKK